MLSILTTVPRLIIDDLGMRKLPHTAAEDLLEIIMRRYERASAHVESPGRRLGEAFDFERPEGRDFTETIRTLAGLSRFVIADITSPRSTPLELQATVPEFMIPFVPIIEAGQEAFAMFQDLLVKHSAWVLAPLAYSSTEELLRGLDSDIIEPALAKSDELTTRKAAKVTIRRIGGAKH